jgi:hypothetical protein
LKVPRSSPFKISLDHSSPQQAVESDKHNR